MNTSSIISPDGIRIAYDVSGEGPAIFLLHGGGGGQTRQSWHQAGYVKRLENEFQVIAMDIRGHGESDKPTDPNAYSIDKMCQDILVVADACDVRRFCLWGYSYGGNIGRYLAAQSSRVAKLIIMGIPFGLAASGDFREFIQDFRSRWTPIVGAIADGSVEPSSLSDDDLEVWQEIDVPVTLAWLTAMLEWGDNEPGDLRCPTLWLAGSENESTIASMKVYEGMLEETNVKAHVVKGLNHAQEFEKVDIVFPVMLSFTRS